MIIIRIAYASSLPPLEQLLEENTEEEKLENSTASSSPDDSPNIRRSLKKQDESKNTISSRNSSMTALAFLPKKDMKTDPIPHADIEDSLIEITTFKDLLHQLALKKEIILQSHLKRNVHLVKFSTGNIELRLKENAPKNLPGELGDLLKIWTGKRWVISLSQEDGIPTFLDQEIEEKEHTRKEILADTFVTNIMKTFPDSDVEILEKEKLNEEDCKK